MKRIVMVLLALLLLAGCSGQKPERVPETMTLAQEGAYILSDGTRVDRWITDVFQDTVYKTDKGWELLRIGYPVDIANVGVADMDGFRQLSEPVQAKVRAYYDENWPKLDIQALLENAWADCNSADPAQGPFSPHDAYQSVFPVAENDAIMCFAIETSIVGSDNVAAVERVHTIFDRTTGEVIDVWDLFTVEKAEALDTIAGVLAAESRMSRDEIRAGLELENAVRLQQGGVEFFFPRGTLSGSEYDHYMYLQVSDLDIWQDWAITERID